MKIERKDNKIIIELDRLQKSYDAVGTYFADVPNLIGIIAECKNPQYSISQAIDMGYNGKGIQEGMPIINFETRKELEEACQKVGIDIWEHECCAKCKKTIYGSMTMDNEGKYICLECEK